MTRAAEDPRPVFLAAEMGVCMWMKREPGGEGYCCSEEGDGHE